MLRHESFPLCSTDNLFQFLDLELPTPIAANDQEDLTAPVFLGATAGFARLTDGVHSYIDQCPIRRSIDGHIQIGVAALERFRVTRPHDLPIIRHSEDTRPFPTMASERLDSGPLERMRLGWRDCCLGRLARRCGSLLNGWRRLDTGCMHGIANDDAGNQPDNQPASQP